MNLIIDLFNNLLTYPILNVLMELYHLLGDFGLSIVALTCLIFLALFPFTWRQFKAMRAIQTLQPEIAEIKRRFADDWQARGAALQALYKEHHLSPISPIVSSILPLLFLSGLFYALNVVLHNAALTTINRVMYPFLVHFSSLPDLNLTWFTILNAAWHISLGYPDPTHILPLLTGLVTFVQMRMAQPLVENRDTILQASQLFSLVLSVGITIFFAWQFAAGVALYRLAWLFFSMLQSYFLNGWGSLWSLPAFSFNMAGLSAIHSTTASQPQARPRKRRGGGSSRRRRGRGPRGGR